ncbi:reverse transcriptase/maturase [Lentisphaera araneosa HTCC2155]|uniref:Reverse transcriptase/maturase n=2 Tax=Lentisphaera TaxID=256846 RepID=A6DIS6_9BACT|nr:reverse transcriptase/maturase [Lentisphaera araneosa HTCC2155]
MTKHTWEHLGRTEEIRAWASTSVWTDQMLGTLETRVEGKKWYSLIDKVAREVNLIEAWESVRANGGSHGVDMVSLDRYESELEHNTKQLMKQLQAGTYLPQCVRRVEIPKADGKTRALGIPTVRDRVVQTALKNVIEPIYDVDFLHKVLVFVRNVDVKMRFGVFIIYLRRDSSTSLMRIFKVTLI